MAKTGVAATTPVSNAVWQGYDLATPVLLVNLGFFLRNCYVAAIYVYSTPAVLVYDF